MIEKFFTKTFTVQRNEYVELDGVYASTEDEIGTFKGHLQQANPQIVQNLALNLSTTFTIWCPVGTDVKTGDRLESGGNSYAVRLIQDNSFVGSNTHLELVVEKEENQESDNS